MSTAPVAAEPIEPPSRSSAPVIALLISALIVAAASIAAVIIQQQTTASDRIRIYWPFVVVVISVGLIITLITIARLHAFVALVLAAISAGLMTLPGTIAIPKARTGELPPNHAVTAVAQSAIEFGSAAGGIGIVIGLASIIGVCLLESGSADKVVRRFLAIFGEKRAGFALLLATYVVSIPIFFDTLFMLLVPIAQALWLRTKKDYLLYVMAICCAGVITHSMVIPHPGPLAMAESLNVSQGLTIVMGLLSGLGPLFVGWITCRLINRKMVIEPPADAVQANASALDKPESELPSFLAAIAPVILPVLLISLFSFTNMLLRDKPGVYYTLMFIGERHVALTIGAVIAVAVLMKQKRVGFAQVATIMDKPLATAGVIILITAAGGAFGAMLRNSGIQGSIKELTGGASINLIILSYIVAVVIRVAQGSATVAMLTTAGIMAPMMAEATAAGTMPYHPVYIFLSIGYGAFCCSWMNDSGFWVVSRLGGMTEKQTLKSWTVLQTVDSFAGLGMTILLAKLFPLV